MKAAVGIPPPAIRKAVLIGALLFSWCLWAMEARACIVEIYGFGTRATAMGGAYTAVADDFSATYYNPAGLMFPREPEKPFPKRRGFNLDVGYMWGQPWFYIQDPGQPKQYPHYASTSGPYGGIRIDPVDFFGAFDRKVFAFALGFYVPANHLFFYDRYLPEDRKFPFFYDYSQRFVVLPSISIGILRSLSLGLGVRFLLRFHTDTIGSVDVNAGDFLTRQFLQTRTVQLGKDQVFLGEFEKMTVQLAPVVGLMYVPLERLRLGFVYRGQNYINDFGFTNPVINLAGLLSFPQGFQFKFARFFTPHTFVLGVSGRLLDKLTLSFDICYYMWHKYLDIEANRPDPRWHDTWVPRVGVEYELFDWWLLRGGYFYYTSPVPNQSTAVNNFLDNDRNVFSLGSEWVIHKPSTFWFKPIMVGLAVQYQQCVRRTYTKASPQAPYAPEYSFGGNILFVTGQVSLVF